jgi:exosortase
MSTSPAAPPAPAAFTLTKPTIAYWLLPAVAIALAIALFSGTFVRLVHLWERDNNYSHGYLVVGVSLALGYRAYRRGGPPVSGEIAWGMTGLAFGIFCQWLVTVIRWPPLSFLGLVFVLRGLLVCAGGREWTASFTFPLLFLFFMFPLPVSWTSFASIWLQDVVSRVSETVLSLFVVCHRVGHSIQIAGVDRSLIVAEECSGLGQIVSFVAFALLLGHLLARPMWYRAALVAIAVPVAIAANTLRVVIMNLGAAYFGTRWMTGTLHDAPAVFSIPVGVGLFLLFDYLLSGLLGEEPTAAAAPAGPNQPEHPDPDTAGPQPAPLPASTTPPVRGLTAAAVVLLVGVGVQAGLAAHIRASGEPSYPTLRARLETLPLSVLDPATGQPVWVGIEQPDVQNAIQKKLPFPTEDILVRTYRDVRPESRGANAQLYMVHSRDGEDRKHHPEICIRDVSGAPEDLSFRSQVSLRSDGTGPPAAQRFRFQTGVNRSVVVYYWHYTLRPEPDPSRTWFQRLHQRVGVSAPSVTVQVSAGGEDPDALAAIEKFLLPGLDAAARHGVLPPSTETGCHRVPVALLRN